MYATNIQEQAFKVTFRPGMVRDIHGTKRRDIFLAPNRSFSDYFKEAATIGRA